MYRIIKILYSYMYEVKKNAYKKKEMRGNIGKLKNKESSIFSHVTYYAVGNVGDTVLSQCVRRTFEKQLSETGWQLISVGEEVNEGTIENINGTKALVIGGGGLFLPDTNKNLVSGWQWAISQELLKKIDVPILIYSVGYNYFKGQESNELFRENLVALCKKAAFIGMRNNGSVEAVKALLPHELREKIVYQPCTTTLIRKIYGNLIPPKVCSKKVAINMAFDREERRFGNNKEVILNEVAKAARMIEARGYEIILVYHVGSDKKIKKYMDASKVRYKEKDLVNALPMQVYKFYNGVEVVLGMRGHAQMIPFGLNCEVISLVSHDKMKWFLEDINATDWQVDLFGEPWELADKIVNKFIEIHEKKREHTRERLLAEQEKLWQITKNNMEKIDKIINYV